jgi:rhodanese-related sulfurtransferase
LDVLVYCRSGNRSIVATEILETFGFKRIYHLSSGIKDWINEGYDLMK